MSGWPELALDVAWLRYGLLALCLLWSWALARGSRAAGLALGALFAGAAVGFWTLCLARPYGLLDDASATRRAAEVAVAAASGRADESFVAGEPAAFRGSLRLLEAGLPVAFLKALPSLLPPLTLVLIGLAVAGLWVRREDALAGACFWLAFSTGDPDAARGLGFVPRLWSHPEAALALPPLALVALAAGRLGTRRAAVAAGLGALVAAAVSSAGPGAVLALPDAVLGLTLDQGPWLVLGAVGLYRTRDAASLGLVAGGGLGLLASSVLPGADGWASQALYRLGLLLASASAARPWLVAAGEWAVGRWPRALAGVRAEAPGLAMLLALLAPGTFTAWWDPVRTDDVARASLEPISPVLHPLMTFIRDETPRDAVFLASADYAPAVAVFGGRRVLRAPSVMTTADDVRRVRAEGAILAGRPIPPGGSDHGVGFVLLAPGDFKARDIHSPADLEGRPGFALRYADPAGFRVYELVR